MHAINFDSISAKNIGTAWFRPRIILLKTNNFIKTTIDLDNSETMTCWHPIRPQGRAMTLPGQEEHEYRHSHVGQRYVDPHLQREGRQEGEQVRRLLHRLRVQQTDA